MKAPPVPGSQALHAPVDRWLALFAALLICALAQAQEPAGSLTDKFPGMSAKERSRIAAQESVDAAKDTAYQHVMRSAQQQFQAGRYEEALASYEKARSMRPYNVHPKVKIEDLRALIAGRKSGTITQPAAGGAASRTMIAAPVQAAHRASPGTPSTAAVPVQAGDGGEQHVQRDRTREAVELQYKEGRAHVIERSLSVNGRVVVYKRVLHECGQIFHFEDGMPVDERVWKARFPR